jgi:hypothetical protein
MPVNVVFIEWFHACLEIFGRNRAGPKALGSQDSRAEGAAMVAQMNRLENAARIAMGDDGFLAPAALPTHETGLSAAARLALAAAALTALLLVLAELV